MGLETAAVIGEAILKRKARLLLGGVKQQYAKIIAYSNPKDGFKDSKPDLLIGPQLLGLKRKWVLEAMFNPDSLEYTKESKWKTTTTPFSSAGVKSYGGSMPGNFKLDLTFDTSDVGESVFEAYIKFVEQLLEVNHKEDPPLPPPPCRFKWGGFSTPLMIAIKATIKYTMFLADGTPLRATASMEFEEYDDEALAKKASQNPTSVSFARKIWRVAPGETLDWIAYQEYGNPAHWRHIANTNNLRNPMDLKPGTILKLVPLA
jgi:hypothetical protein